jgi:hypothetical protein
MKRHSSMIAALAVLALTPATPASALIVYDPTNYVQMRCRLHARFSRSTSRSRRCKTRRP